MTKEMKVEKYEFVKEVLLYVAQICPDFENVEVGTSFHSCMDVCLNLLAETVYYMQNPDSELPFDEVCSEDD